MAVTSKSFPTIVACGDSENEIGYFCLKLEGQAIPVIQNQISYYVYFFECESHTNKQIVQYPLIFENVLMLFTGT